MITFNDTLEKTQECLLGWSRKDVLKKVTIIRDVQGKISLLFENTEYPEETAIAELQLRLEQGLHNFYAKRLFWKKLSSSQKRNKENVGVEIIAEIVENSRAYWNKKENIDFYVAERPIAKKAWVNTTALQQPVWTYEDAIQGNGTKIITFYSFKGGMGRTTALAGVALILAEQGKNVMMIDMDVEAPGLSTLFFEEDAVKTGVLDYLLEKPLDESRSVRDYVLSVSDPALMKEDDGNLYLMPAGKVDANYLQKLARIDYQDNRENYLKMTVQKMLTELRQEYQVDYILVDARAGFHDMGGIAVAQIPHGAVLIGNASKQSWDGLTQVIHTIAQCHRKDDFSIMIVDSMCERATSDRALQQREEFLNMAYAVCVDNYYDKEDAMPGIDADEVEHKPEYIPFDAELLQGFELFSSGKSESDGVVKAYRELLTGKVYQAIVQRIKSWFGE